MIQRTFSLEGGLSAPLAIGLGAVLVIEGAVLHLWVAERSAAWAWGVTALNVVTLVWLWREHRATRQAQLVVDDDAVAIDAGSRLRCRIPLSAIASAEPATWRSVPDVPSSFANTAKPLEPNVVIVLREPVDVALALGLKKRVGRIGVRVADADALVSALSRSRG